MNVLFITLYNIEDISQRGIYEDLLREFIKEKHCVYIVSPSERRYAKKTHIIKGKHFKILKVRTGNIQKTSIVEKGISTVLLERQFNAAIKRYFDKVKFDLVLYSTPPITVMKAVEFIKKRDGARTYLLLKDIFPQNAVDMGMLNRKGIKGILYRYFRNKEKKLYALSEHIGCMSQANVDYVLRHNREIDRKKVEICPNCVEPKDNSVSQEERMRIRRKYGIPTDREVFVYGGNLGKPQGISFLIKCLRSQKNNQDVFFLIVGSGTEYGKIEKYLEEEKQENIKLMNKLPKEDYDRMVGSCDVGMLFLDHRFTIPNFPSRLLSYMEAKLPVLAVTDPNTDVGKTAVQGGFGWWCESNSVDDFSSMVRLIVNAEKAPMGEAAFDFLKKYYSSHRSYTLIMEKMRGFGR